MNPHRCSLFVPETRRGRDCRNCPSVGLLTANCGAGTPRVWRVGRRSLGSPRNTWRAVIGLLAGSRQMRLAPPWLKRPGTACQVASLVSMPEEIQPQAAEGEHIAPVVNGESFHCMHCGVLAEQDWAPVRTTYNELPYRRCICHNCRNRSLWTQDGRCIDPVAAGGPRPHIDMPEDVKADYEEARQIVGMSPRGACALLRLAVQKLCADLGEKGKNIDDDIAALVTKGLPVEVQQALDSLRVIGNEAVHPGELDLRDDVETATALFDLLNFVVKDRIAEPKERRRIFGLLPEKKRAAIDLRDGKDPDPQ